MTCPQNKERCTLCGFCTREKHKAQNFVIEKAKKFDQIKYLWQMIGLEEGDFVLPDDAAIMRQIDEAFQTSIDSDKLGSTTPLCFGHFSDDEWLEEKNVQRVCLDCNQCGLVDGCISTQDKHKKRMV